MVRRRCGLREAWLCVLALGLPAVHAVAEDSPSERKGQFVERVTRFVEWPAGALPQDAPFVVCVAGRGATAERLLALAEKNAFKGRAGDGRRVGAGSALESCHVLFIEGSESERLAEVLAGVEGRPVLTVGDSKGFAERGVLINFFEEGDLVRFEINLPAVKRSRLVFRTSLLRLGRVIGAPAAPPPGGAR